MELLTVRDCAALLKISVSQIRRLLRSGRFPQPLRIGRAIRWRVQDVAAFIDAGADMHVLEKSGLIPSPGKKSRIGFVSDQER